jgi:hypothetical protein
MKSALLQTRPDMCALLMQRLNLFTNEDTPVEMQ